MLQSKVNFPNRGHKRSLPCDSSSDKRIVRHDLRPEFDKAMDAMPVDGRERIDPLFSSTGLTPIISDGKLSKAMKKKPTSRTVSRQAEWSSKPVPRSSKAIGTNHIETRGQGTQTAPDLPPASDNSPSEVQELKLMMATILSKLSEVTEANSSALIILADEVRQGKARMEESNKMVMDIKRETQSAVKKNIKMEMSS